MMLPNDENPREPTAGPVPERCQDVVRHGNLRVGFDVDDLIFAVETVLEMFRGKLEVDFVKFASRALGYLVALVQAFGKGKNVKPLAKSTQKTHKIQYR